MINVHLVGNYSIIIQSVSIGQYLFCVAPQRTTAIFLGLELKRLKKGNHPRKKRKGFYVARKENNGEMRGLQTMLL